MNLEKHNIKQVAGSTFYVNKKSPMLVSYRIPANPNDWKKVELSYNDEDISEPNDDEILYYYNELKGLKIKINEL